MNQSTNISDLTTSLDALDKEIKSINDIVAYWTKSGDTIPSFDFLKVDQAHFTQPPLEVIRLLRGTSLATGAGVWETMVWDTVSYNTGHIIYTTVSTGIIQTQSNVLPEIYLLFGTVVWEANSSGERLLRFNELTTYGQVSRMVSDATPFSGPGQTEPFAFTYKKRKNSSGFNFQVWQNGAPNIGVERARMNIVRIAVSEANQDTTRTLIIQPPTQDSYVEQSKPTLNHGGSTEIIVRQLDVDAQRHGYIQFDLSQIPPGINIISADLEIYVSSITDVNNDAYNINVHRVVSSWDEGTITWNNASTWVSTLMGSASTTPKDVWQTFSLSTAEFVAMQSSNYGVILKYNFENAYTSNDSMFYVSKEESAFFTRHPRLVVKYTGSTI